MFAAPTSTDPKTGKTLAGSPQTLAGIPFDVQPVPVFVPKRSVAADYSAPRMTLR